MCNNYLGGHSFPILAKTRQLYDELGREHFGEGRCICMIVFNLSFLT